MLGIRHFKRSAIDLYLGDITEFCSDVIVTACNPDLSPISQQDKSILSTSGKAKYDLAKETQFKGILDAEIGHLPCSKLAVIMSDKFENDFKKMIFSSLDYAREFNKRHISFPVWLHGNDIKRAGEIFFQILHEYLSKNESLELRLTVVLNTKEDYFYFQDEMFKVFPEETK